MSKLNIRALPANTSVGIYTVVTMPAGKLYRLDQAAIVVCARGTAWVTQEGDWHDHVLRPGDTFDGRRPGLVVVQAMDDVELHLVSATGARVAA